MELSKTERLMLYNQYQILSKLYPENEDNYNALCEIVANGYKHNYSELTQGFEDDLSEEISKEVYDILQMYRSLYGSYRQLKDNSGIDEDKVMFNGFDGNEESKHYFYARFLIEDFDLYGEFEGRDLNTHHRTLEKYRRMLKAWSKYERYAALDKNQIMEILNID